MTSEEATRHYMSKFGWSIIPVKKDKHPFIQWLDFNQRLATSEEISKWSRTWPNHNVAVVTGPISNLLIIDIDTNEGHNEIKRYVPEDIMTPMCSTPSLGLHMYFKMPAFPIGNSVRILPGVDVRADHGYAILPPSVGREGVCYEWLPGQSPDEIPLAEVPPALLEILTPRMTVTPEGLFRQGRRMPEGDLLAQGRRDEDLFHVANGMIKGGMTYQETLDYLMILASRCDPPFSPEEARLKVDSAIRRAMQRERNISSEVADWIGDTKGWFSIKDLYHQLGLSTRQLQKIAMTAINKMKEEKAIEQHTGMNGMYRKMLTDVNFITLEDETDPYVNINWPFSIEDWVLTLPKSVTVVAGTPNSGKSAFLLNAAFMNQMNFERIRYFSSEMGKSEIVTRVKKFGYPLTEWNKIEFLERSADFADLILPNDLNIVDFLELHDNFFTMGGEIKKIFDALDTGLAIIAIQKNPGAPTGIGGYRGLEKPRLYLNMENGTIQIVKAKNWALDYENPNGLKCEFKLLAGSTFRQTSDWHR